MTVPQNPLEALTLDQLRARTSEKWQHYPPEILPLWVAEMDVLPAAPVVDAVHRAMALGDTGYPSGAAYPQALQEFAANRWHFSGFDLGRMRTVPDVMTGITAALNVLTDPGDAVIVCSPVYPPFYIYPKAIGRKVLEAPLGPSGRMDPEAVRRAFERAVTTTSQPVLLLANPHNPTGAAHTPEELTAVAQIAREFNGRVISDEIHAPLVLPGAQFTPFLSVDGSENGFSVFSSSKAWNLPGLKAAVLSAGPQAAQDLARIPRTVDAGASHLGVLAHTAALNSGRSWLDDLLAGLAGNRQLVTELVSEHLPGVRLRPAEATYLAWMDCTDLDLQAANTAADGGHALSAQFGLTGPAAFFMDHAGVALNDGATFGTGGKGHVRLNFGTSTQILQQALQATGSALTRSAGF